MNLSGDANYSYLDSAKSNYLSLPKWQRIVLILIFSLLSILTLSETQPERKGDGYEYIAMSQAFLSHGTPNITEDDVAKIVQYSGNKSLKGFVELSPLTLNLKGSPPYFKGKSEKIYSYHFWLYSLINTPAFLFTRTLGVPDTLSFSITNLAMALVASFVIFSSIRLTGLQRFSFLGFFWVCGTTYYLRWGHPEVFSAAFTCCALVFFYDRNYVIAAIFAAIASTQNPPIAILAAAMMGFGFILSIRKNGLKNSSVTIPLYFLASSVVLFAPLFWKFNFDTWSLISKCGGAKTGLISAERVFSFIFDLNQGMLVGSGSYFLAIIVCGLVSLFHREVRLLCLAFYFILVTLMMTTLCAATINMNSDCNVLSRYAYWLSIPIGFAAVILVDRKRMVSMNVIGFAFVSQAYIVGSQNIFGGESYLKMNKLAKSVFSNHPFFYNPVPEIFIRRVMKSDNFPTREGTMYAWVHNKMIKKVLFNRGVGGHVPFQRKNIENFDHEVVKMDGGWEYWNFYQSPKSKLRNGGYLYATSVKEFNMEIEAGSDDAYFPVGWCASEKTHRWSLGKFSELNFSIGKSTSPPTRISIFGFPLGSQNAVIKLNGSLIYRAQYLLRDLETSSFHLMFLILKVRRKIFWSFPGRTLLPQARERPGY